MEELIKRLERVIATGVPDKDGMHPISAETMLEVVKSQLGTNLAEVGTDCISRQAAIDYFVINVGFHDEDGYPIEDTDELRKIWTEYFDGIPSAEPKMGKWIKTARWGRVYYCDQCRNYLDFDGVNAGRGSTNYCPNCGSYNGGEYEI